MTKVPSFSSSIGWAGSKGTDLKSIPIGRTNSGWGSGGAPNLRGVAPAMPIIRVPKGDGLGNGKRSGNK